MGVPTRRILNPIFGEPTLVAYRNSDAVWARGQAVEVYQKAPSGWVANLYGGVQTNDDWASILIPVNEMPVYDLTSAMWTYYMTNAESAGVNIVIWVHDPADFGNRAEITQTMGEASKAAGWNDESLDSTADELFFYGEGTTGTGLTAGTEYGWDDFQDDVIFKGWHIYRISFDYGWLASSTLDDVWVADVQINGTQIILKPDSGGSGRIGRRHYLATSEALAGTLSPKTPFRLLTLDAHVDGGPDSGEALTLTRDAGQGTVHDTLIFSFDLEAVSATSLYKTFEGLGMFASDDEIVLAQTNTGDDNWGVTITYQTVFGGM